MKKIIIIAAMKREVALLVTGWSQSSVMSQNRPVHLFVSDKAIVAYAGVGVINARIAAAAAYQHASGEVALMVSAGLAGSLIPEFEVGEIFAPATVIDDVDGGKLETASGDGTLVTASSIANSDAKRRLAAKHIARAVDMEAFAVGDVAKVYSVPFIAIKSISDQLDFPMPPLGRFMDDKGDFNTAGFALFATIRPWLWPSVIQLGKNSSRATDSLCRELYRLIQQPLNPGLYNRSRNSSKAKS